MKRAVVLFLSVVLALSLCACLDVPAKEKTFTVDNLSIVLNDDFFRMDQVAPGYNFCISSEDVVIFGSRVDLAENGLEGAGVEEYATAYSGVLEEETEMTRLDGRPVVRYYAKDAEGDLQIVNIVFYQTQDCFWLLSFISDADDFAEEKPEIWRYANSVTFGQGEL